MIRIMILMAVFGGRFFGIHTQDDNTFAADESILGLKCKGSVVFFNYVTVLFRSITGSDSGRKNRQMLG
jgi:hypothetical protein